MLALPPGVATKPPPLSVRVESERIVLRPPRPADVGELRSHMRSNRSHLRPWAPTTPVGEDPWSLTEVSKALVRHRREWTRGESYVFLICAREPGDPIIGRVALTGVSRGVFQNAFVGYSIAFERQGNGLMTEALAATLTFAFETANLHRVQAAVMPNNIASLRVVDKLRFRREGLAERYLHIAGKWEDHCICAITAEEWADRGPRTR